MAETEAPAIDPAKSYRVQLARALEVVPGVWARPSDHEVILKGDAVALNGDAIASYEEV
ncbi:hypothetical protein [Bradyrhizobium phage BDU-MI-1]|nr:hypothetical protein [Bradyrhizobium phage BDU-MI-1]